MPINIPDGLPAKETLHQERIFALEEEVANNQQIRPLRVVILNLMPTKVETETQILRLISKSPLQVSCDFMRVSSHEATHVSADHLVKFYDTFDALKDNYYDGFIVTGAPVEQMEFEDVDYWDEFCRIIDWSQTHVLSTMYLCWGALAGLYHLYGIPKKMLGAKLFGVFKQRLCDEYNFLTNGFDEVHFMPPSRHAAIDTSALAEQLGAEHHLGPRRAPRAAGPLRGLHERPGTSCHARLPRGLRDGSLRVRPRHAELRVLARLPQGPAHPRT